ncbi:MAG: hypothetical protein JNL98_37245, partial [Bryobacterales bacterium]|nr:hypothetical protein [Bryobacterales bacterium]
MSGQARRERAMALLEEAVRARPNDAAAQMMLGVVSARRAHEREAGTLREALAELEKASALDPSMPWVNLWRARWLWE